VVEDDVQTASSFLTPHAISLQLRTSPLSSRNADETSVKDVVLIGQFYCRGLVH